MVRSFEIEHGCVLKTDLEDNPISVYPIPLQLLLFLFFLPCTFFIPSCSSYLFLVTKITPLSILSFPSFPFREIDRIFRNVGRKEGRERFHGLAWNTSIVWRENGRTRSDEEKRGGARSNRSISSSTRNRTFSSFAIDKKTSSTTINLFLLYERFPSFLFTWKPSLSVKKSLLIHMPVIMYFIRYTHMLIHKTHVHTLTYLLRMSRVILSVVSILMIANHPLVENDQ